MSIITRIPYTQPRTGDGENASVPKRPQPNVSKTDCEVVHCSTMGNKHWMFDPRLADVVNQFAPFPI